MLVSGTAHKPVLCFVPQTNIQKIKEIFSYTTQHMQLQFLSVANISVTHVSCMYLLRWKAL